MTSQPGAAIPGLIRPGSTGFTPSSLSFLSFDSTLWRVRINLAAIRTSLGHNDTALIERSLDQIRWADVRGGIGVSLTTTALPGGDYEYVPEEVNYYRVTTTSGPVYTDSITPSLNGQILLINLRYPFLNIAVSPSDAGDITYTSLGGTFPVMGRSWPVAVTQVRASAQFSLTLATQTRGDRDALRATLSTGQVMLIQVPDGSPCQLDPGYYSVGDCTESRNGVPWDLRWMTLPLTTVAAPGPDVVPVLVTWQTVVNLYPSWSSLILAQPNWSDVLSLVGAAADLITA